MLHVLKRECDQFKVENIAEMQLSHINEDISDQS